MKPACAGRVEVDGFFQIGNGRIGVAGAEERHRSSVQQCRERPDQVHGLFHQRQGGGSLTLQAEQHRAVVQGGDLVRFALDNLPIKCFRFGRMAALFVQVGLRQLQRDRDALFGLRGGQPAFEALLLRRRQLRDPDHGGTDGEHGVRAGRRPGLFREIQRRRRAGLASERSAPAARHCPASSPRPQSNSDGRLAPRLGYGRVPPVAGPRAGSVPGRWPRAPNSPAAFRPAVPCRSGPARAPSPRWCARCRARFAPAWSERAVRKRFHPARVSAE